jgi:AcrR family transcriptional regulator
LRAVTSEVGRAHGNGQSELDARSAGDERTAERRRQLVAVAAKLFAEQGFHGTSMLDIARAFGLRKASLYHWVESKESLLSQVLADAVDETAAELGSIAGRDLPASERLRLMIDAHIRSWVRNPHNQRVAMFETRWLEGEARERWVTSRDAVKGAYERVLIEGREAGEFEFDPASLSILVNNILAVMNFFPRWYDPQGWASPEVVAQQMADLLLRGLLRRSREGGAGDRG